MVFSHNGHAMRLLESDQCDGFIHELGIRRGDDQSFWYEGYKMTYGAEIEVPTKAPALTALVSWLLRLHEAESTLLLWAYENGVPEPSRFQTILHRLRVGTGDLAPIASKPGHLFAPAEKLFAYGMALLSLLSGWTAVLIGSGVSHFFLMSNARLYVIARSRPELEVFLDTLRQSGFIFIEHKVTAQPFSPGGGPT